MLARVKIEKVPRPDWTWEGLAIHCGPKEILNWDFDDIFRFISPFRGQLFFGRRVDDWNHLLFQVEEPVSLSEWQWVFSVVSQIRHWNMHRLNEHEIAELLLQWKV